MTPIMTAVTKYYRMICFFVLKNEKFMGTEEKQCTESNLSKSPVSVMYNETQTNIILFDDSA